jgi:hypothetical protein
MRKRTATLVVLGAFAPGIGGVALATAPTGLKSELLARGGAGELEIHDKSMGLKLDAGQPTDVAVVRATLEPGGSTGWHGHPGPSIVVVKSGAVTLSEPGHRDHGRRRCSTQVFNAGSSFVHPEHAHTFVNSTDVVTEFFVVYMVPAGAAPLLNDVDPAPPECS